MADEQDNETEEVEEQPEPVSNPGAEKRLTASRDAARRELAFVKAGIDTDTQRGKLILKSYDGELTAEAIKAYEAEIFGPAVRGDDPTPAEIHLAEDRRFLATGGETGSEVLPPEHPHLRGMTAAGEVWRATADEDRAAKAFLDQTLYAAFAEHDGRVILQTRPGGGTTPLTGP